MTPGTREELWLGNWELLKKWNTITKVMMIDKSLKNNDDWNIENWLVKLWELKKTYKQTKNKKMAGLDRKLKFFECRRTSLLTC